MLNQAPEQSLYSVYESKQRALIPKAITLIFLAFIFYIGVLINISLLELGADQETALKTGALVILALLIILGLLLTAKRSRQPYLFFRNRIAQGKKSIYYASIASTAPQVNFIDQIFNTYSIPLGKTFTLRHIPENIQLSNYLQQLIEYAKKNQ